MDVREELRILVAEIIKTTTNPDEKKKLQTLLDNLGSIPDEQLHLLLKQLQFTERNRRAQMSGTAGSGDSTSLESSGFDARQPGIMVVERLLKYYSGEKVIDRRTVEVKHDSEKGLIMSEKHIHAIDCPHINREPTIRDAFGHLLCGDPECTFICKACGQYGCRKCGVVVKTSLDEPIYYHETHLPWWRRIFS